ncbi:MAG: type 4a pilus biogenesis protein PilO [Thermodesulfobacteriota bacterium]|nr:type 4a pilus biogenesis protein PilO [Thermodesulfobacteriota bacterium]
MIRKFPLIGAAWELNRSPIIVIIVLSILVIAVFSGQRWISEPELQTLRTEQSRLQQQVRQRHRQLTNSSVPVSATEQLKRNLQQFHRLIPAQTNFSNFIGELFGWAQQADLDIHQVSYQTKEEKETNFLRYGLSFSVKGSYSQIKKFLHLLENTNRILLIEKISLAGSSAKTKDQQQVNLRIELSTYFQGEAI